MSNIRNQIELGFERLAGFVFVHRYKTLAAMLVLVAVLVSQIRNIAIDTSTEGFLHNDDPALTEYENFREQFGRDQVAIIALKPADVFDADFLKRLKALHDDLSANLPHLDEVTSLINARNTRGDGDSLIVEDLLQNWPDTPEALAAVKQRALANNAYRNLLVSEDARFTTVIVRTQAFSSSGEDDDLTGFGEDGLVNDTARVGVDGRSRRQKLTDQENSEVVRAIEAVLAKHPFPDTEILVGGPPVVADYLKRTMMRDMRKFLGIALLTIAVFLLILFRRLAGVLFPVVIVILSLLSTVGLMAFFGVALKLPTQILPSFLLAVGVGDSVHILVIFFRNLNRLGDRKAAIETALGHSGLAVLMTSLTTAGGLLSFSTAAVEPVASLGRFAAAGVMLAFVYTIVLLPVLLSIFPIKPKGRQREQEASAPPSLSDRLLAGVGRVSIRYPYRVIGCSAVLIAVALIGTTRIYFSHNPVKWLPPDNPVRLASEAVDQELRGSTSIEVVIDTGKENGLYDPAILNQLENSAGFMEGYQSAKLFVGKAWSLSTVLKEINQALHANDERFYSIPQDRDLVAQEFLLFENSGSDDLEDFTDSQFSKARFIIKVPFIDAIGFTGFLEEVGAHFRNHFPDTGITVTGTVALYVRVITSAIISLRQSYVYAFVVITILMILLIGKVRIGLLSMVPNIAPIIVMLGIMGWFGMAMHLFNMLVGSIAIGLAVDDTIHFMHNFRRYFESSNDAEFAVLETLHTTGRAMLVTTCVLSIGFFTFMFSDMINLFEFGLLTGITIMMALMSDYFLAPALMIVVNRRRSEAVETAVTASDG